MIVARSNFARLVAGLTAKAAALGAARAQSRRLSRTDPDQGWRRAPLLWPLFRN